MPSLLSCKIYEKTRQSPWASILTLVDVAMGHFEAIRTAKKKEEKRVVYGGKRGGGGQREREREQLLAWRRAHGARGNQIFVGNNVSCHRRKWLRFSVLRRWLQERKRKQQAPSETGAGPGDEMARDQPTWTVMGFARRTRHLILLDSSPRTKIGVT